MSLSEQPRSVGLPSKTVDHQTHTTVREVFESDDSSQGSLPWEQMDEPHMTKRVKDLQSHPPRVSELAKAQEFGRLVRTKFQHIVRDGRTPYIPLSDKGRFIRTYVHPMCTWWGKNDRILLSPNLNQVSVQDAEGHTSLLVNGATHDYIGFYRSDERIERLHRFALDYLPLNDAQSIPDLSNAVNDAVSSFFLADFCVTTHTGYGANYIALPALIDSATLVLLDSDSHNSMWTGTFLGKPKKIIKFRHNDMSHLRDQLFESRGRYSRTIVCIEGLYSMEGDEPPLWDLHLLKREFGFVLFCDEAHSFLARGSTGRGCVESWNEEHLSETVPEDLVDIRVATLSKAVGGVGGIICGKSELKSEILQRHSETLEDGGETLSTAQMLQTLYVLKQPCRIQRAIRTLSQIAQVCREELARAGIFVYGHHSAHILPVHTGGPCLASKLSLSLRRRGLMASPISPPAVPFWGGRVRVTLSAGQSDDDVRKLLSAIIQGCQEVGVCRNGYTLLSAFRTLTRPAADPAEEFETLRAQSSIQVLLDREAERQAQRPSQHLEKFRTACGPQVLAAGHAGRKTLGLNSGGSRLVCGTFAVHLDAEAAIAKTTGFEAGIIYTDARIGLASTIAALSRPVLKYSKHTMLIPQGARQAIIDGTVFCSRKEAPQLLRYNHQPQHSCADLRSVVASIARSTYLTVILQIENQHTLDQLAQLIDALVKYKRGMTILVHSSTFLIRRDQLGDTSKNPSVQIVISGSFRPLLGLSGGFITGSSVLLDEFRYSSRACMFTTSPQPWVAEMIRVALS